MKLSIFTPTHKPDHLQETYDSLLRQYYDEWEWVIVLNNGAKREDIPHTILESNRSIHVVEGPKTDKIGALKRFACQRCTGDVFIELDHDDMLVPGTLAEIVKVAKENPTSFIYSDAAVFEGKEAEKSWGYNRLWGWEHYPMRVYGKPFVATKTFPVTPRSLCEVYVAPDHVRVWTRKAYEKVGGHDITLDVCDDHDLICRTYIAGIPFVHLGGCHYLYRWHPNNTVKERQKKIWAQNDTNRRLYLPALINEWCNRDHHARILAAADSVAPVDRKYGHIHSRSRLQYLDGDRHAQFFNSAFEALQPGGYLTVDVPSTKGKGADQDPRTKVRFNDNSFRYYSDKRFAQLNSQVKCQFQIVDIHEHYPDKFHEAHDMKMLRVIMCALKGQRQPGPVFI